MKNRGGVTLMELMIAVALIGIGILGATAAFNGIHKSIQYSKARTLASNIAQEKMQIITQKPYYEILVTTAPALYTNVNPNFSYDPFYFVPDSLTEGGVNFTRYTNIQVVQEVNGNIVVLNPLTPDTGIRQITETVVWATDSGNRALTIQSIINNPDTAMASTWLSGTVTDVTSGSPIKGALVDAAENVGWRDTANATGNYKINLVPGTFNFLASASGYFTSRVTQSVAFNNSTPLNFSLTAIASGTVTGTAWVANHPVISQVVASTGPLNNIEYVDLYNPTTAPINMGTNVTSDTPNVWSVVFDDSNNVQQRQLIYISTFIPANGYYLITNTGDACGGSCSPSDLYCSTITISGVIVQPDACWRYVGGTPPNYNHTLQCHNLGISGCSTSQNAGGYGIGTNGGLPWSGIAGTTKYDAIAWHGNGTTPPYSETTAATPSSANGMVPGEAFVRRLDTTSATSNSFGNAYDTDNNPVDFIDYAPPTPIPFVPRNSTAILPPETGSPATGARVSVTDGLSATSSATLVGSPPYAQFTVPGVATGTWTVFIDSASRSAEIDNVTIIAANSIDSIPNVELSSNGIVGIISGKVLDAGTLQAIPGGITVTAGGANAVSGLGGVYAIRVTTGTYDVTANPGNANSSYEMQTQTSVPVSLGDATQNINFQLAKGGEISGFISRDGVNPLPGVAVVALDAFGTAHDTEASGNNGKFTLINLTTGAYTVQPTLDTKEVSLPASSTITVSAGITVWVGTFTVVGAMGQVQGTVTANSNPIKSGVLIVVSTQAISSPPPALSSNTLTSAAYYADSSNETGTYSVDVRGSSTSIYNVEAFYMHLNNQTPVISTGIVSSVTVTAGQATTGVNFAW